MDENKLKKLVKETLIEALEKKKDIFYELIAEAINKSVKGMGGEE